MFAVCMRPVCHVEGKARWEGVEGNKERSLTARFTLVKDFEREGTDSDVRPNTRMSLVVSQ